MGKLDQLTITVTGAARGIGQGIALRLAGEGASVCIADLDHDGAEAVAAEIRDAGGNAIGVGCDVRTGQRQAALEAAVE